MPTVKNVTSVGGRGYPLDLDNGVMLAPGASASVGTDASWPRVIALIASGELQLTDAVNPVVAPLSASANAWWRLLYQVGDSFSNQAAQTRYLSDVASVIQPIATASGGVFYFDPADFASGTLTVRLRLRVYLAFNDTAPAAGDWVYTLVPVTGWSGAAGLITPAIGAVVAGSAVTITNPPAGVPRIGVATFTAPAASGYLVQQVSTTMGANGSAFVRATVHGSAS